MACPITPQGKVFTLPWAAVQVHIRDKPVRRQPRFLYSGSQHGSSGGRIEMKCTNRLHKFLSEKILLQPSHVGVGLMQHFSSNKYNKSTPWAQISTNAKNPSRRRICLSLPECWFDRSAAAHKVGGPFSVCKDLQSVGWCLVVAGETLG